MTTVYAYIKCGKRMVYYMVLYNNRICSAWLGLGIVPCGLVIPSVE